MHSIKLLLLPLLLSKPGVFNDIYGNFNLK